MSAIRRPRKKRERHQRSTVGVSPFKDGRGKAASVLGKRTIPSGLENDFVVQGTVAETVTAIMKKALYRARNCGEGRCRLGPDRGRHEGRGVELLLGGEIKTLWLESTATSMQTHLQASVQIKVIIGDPVEKKIVRTIEVSSRLDQDVLYSREKLEACSSEALSSAVDQIFQDRS